MAYLEVAVKLPSAQLGVRLLGTCSVLRSDGSTGAELQYGAHCLLSGWNRVAHHLVRAAYCISGPAMAQTTAPAPSSHQVLQRVEHIDQARNRMHKAAASQDQPFADEQLAAPAPTKGTLGRCAKFEPRIRQMDANIRMSPPSCGAVVMDVIDACCTRRTAVWEIQLTEQP
jgi:hypothetical protein